MSDRMFQLRDAQMKSLGFHYNRKPFIIGFHNVNHARSVQYNSDFQKPNIRLRLNRPHSIYPDIKNVARVDDDALKHVIVNNIMMDSDSKLYVSKHDPKRLRADPLYKELVGWDKYSRYMVTIPCKEFYGIPMQTMTGIALLYDVEDENAHEYCFRCQVLFPEFEDDTNTQNYRKRLETLMLL